MPYASQVSWFYDLSNIWWKATIIQFLIMQSSSLSHYLITLMTKKLPQHPVILHCKPVFFPQCEKPSSTPIQNRQHLLIVLYILICVSILEKQTEDKRFCTEWPQAFPELNMFLIFHKCNFYLLGLFPNICTTSHFQRIYNQFLYCDILLQSVCETGTCT
jgi:hypothetical protein